MASDLMTAMLTGQNQSPLMADPNTMALIPQMSLAQSMLQGSLSGAPAYPAQALGRLAQALVGGQMMDSLGHEAASAYDRSAQAMAKIYPAGTPIGDMLRSDDPYTKFQGVQMAGKAALVNSETKTLGPEQTAVAPRTAAAGGGVVASGSPAQAGAVEAAKEGAKLPYAGPRAEAEESGKARGQFGDILSPSPRPASSLPPIPPSGPPLPPASVPTVVHPSFGGRPAPGFVSSSPAASQTSGGPSTQPSPNLTEGQRRWMQEHPGQPLPTAPSQVFGAPPPEVRGPSPAAEPAALAAEGRATRTDHGTILPPLSDQAPLPRTPAEAKGAVESWQKTRDSWNTALQPGYEAEQRLNTIAKAFKAIETGSFATQKADIAAALKSFGINLPNTNDPAQVQLALHENYIETIQQLKAASTRWTQMEFKALSANREHPDIQPAANLQMLAEDIGTLRQSRDMARDFTEAQRNGWRDPQSFQAAWMRSNPLSGYVQYAKTEIGPLKGMAGAPGAAGGVPPAGRGFNPADIGRAATALPPALGGAAPAAHPATPEPAAAGGIPHVNIGETHDLGGGWSVTRVR